MSFKIKQISDTGTSNPIVARLTIGLFSIIDMAQISKDKKDQIKEICFEIHKILLQAEKVALPIINEIRHVEKDLNENGVKTQSNGMVIEEPSIFILEDSKVFIKHAKQALQQLAKGIGVLLDKEFNGPHFHKIHDEFKNRFGEDHIVTKLLNDDQTWIKEIIDLRNEDEHPKTGKPFTNDFKISKIKSDQYLIEIPRFFNGLPIQNRLEVYSHNLLTFIEEILACTLEIFFPKTVVLIEIAEDEKDHSCPIRFTLGLSDQVEIKSK